MIVEDNLSEKKTEPDIAQRAFLTMSRFHGKDCEVERCEPKATAPRRMPYFGSAIKHRRISPSGIFIPNASSVVKSEDSETGREQIRSETREFHTRFYVG